ncbi:hypothetical protein [Streptomyces sp. NPDC051572]|uniref:hypothetical protein n=1 Tax=Streptomyces sp. NPDC051572 TaxID=3155802 RepID=UPI00344D6DD1
MEMTAYELATRITEARGWTCTPQSFDGQARLMVLEEQRWLGVTTVPAQSATHGHAGTIRADGTPTASVAETSAHSTDMDGLLQELERLWKRRDSGGPPHL